LFINRRRRHRRSLFCMTAYATAENAGVSVYVGVQTDIGRGFTRMVADMKRNKHAAGVSTISDPR